MLRLRSLGQTIIEANEARVTPSAEAIFATTLYLIMEAGRPIGRDELTQLVWPGVSDAQAQHGLRQVLYKLKTYGATIKADRSSLILSPRFCSTDFAELLEPQPNSVLEALAETIGGSFLPGYRPELSEQFATWVERQRDMVHSAVARALVAGMQAKKRVSDWTGAEQLASMCLTIDPLNEEATLTVAEAAALGGSKSKALSILNNYLKEIGDDAGEIKLPAALLRRRISEAYQDNIFPVRDAPFVGREEEMAELTRALARAQKGNGSAYVITGEPGIGKTRLVQEFTRVAALQRVNIVRVGCQSHDVRRPLSVFVDMVPKLLALPGALGCSPESMGYLRRLVAHDPDDSRTRDEPDPTSVSYQVAKTAIFDLLDSVLTEKSALIEIEDAQWLDQYSIRIVEELSNWLSTRRLELILTSRTLSLTSERVMTISLSPLRKTASVEVAAAVAKIDMPDRESFLEWCISSCGGNPFYLLELLHNGKKERDVYQAPKSLTRLLLSRILALSPSARDLLEVCCVLGKHSTIERVEACTELTRSQLVRSLGELECCGMIAAESNKVYSKHDLLTSVVLSSMGIAARRLVHRFAAAQFEREIDATQSVSLMWECAEQWQSASDAPRAIQLLRRCGSHLMDVGLPNEAALVIERAETLATEPAEKFSICLDLARALMRADRCLDAELVLTRSAPLRHSLASANSPLDEHSVMSLQVRWEKFESVPYLENDILDALSSEMTTREERLSAGGWLMTAADNLCNASLAHQIYDRICRDLETPGVSIPAKAWIRMVYHSSFGNVEQALQATEELTRHTRSFDPPITVLRQLRNASHVYRCFTSVEQAIAFASEAWQIAGTTKSVISISSCANVLASLYMQIGDIASAQKWLSHSAKVRDPRNNTVADLNTWSYRAELAIRQGDAKAAQEAVSRCVHDFTKLRPGRSRIRSLALEMQTRILSMQTIDSERIAELHDAFEIAKSCAMQDFSAEALILGLEVVGREDEAVTVARDYLLKYRRDTTAPSADLSNLVIRLGITT